MPKEWSKKDERQYEHIKEGQVKRGATRKRAKEIAAATVNRERQEEGRTPNKTTQGTGNPKKSLDDRTKRELYNMARELRVQGRSNMNKGQLVAAIRKR